MKPWYEKSCYKNFVPKTKEEHWERIWDRFQETIERNGNDNSMGDYNYLIGRYLYESGNYDEKEFINAIKKYLKESE